MQKANILNTIGDVFTYLNNENEKKSYLDSARLYYHKAYNIANSLSNRNIDTEPLYHMRCINIEIRENDFNLNIPLYVDKIIEDNLPSVEEALADLETAWDESLEAEEKFKKILNQFI
mgnify:CR=1 FL=1